MDYTIYYSLKELRFYNDRVIAEMNKTFARSYRRELTRLEKATGIPFNAIRDDYWAEVQDSEIIHDRHFYEDVPDCCSIEKDMNYIKTDRRLFDIAIKKAILAVQKKFDNPLESHCDDGFVYDKRGITFTGAGMADEYQPVKPIRVKFADMPITFRNKGGEMDETLPYDWIGI